MGAREHDRRHRTVFGDAFRFSALIKPDGEVLEIDRQALAFWELSEQEVKGRRFWDIGWQLVHDADARRLRSAVQAAARGRTVRREAAVWHHGEQRTGLSFSLRPVRDADGRVVVLVAHAHNLTRRGQLESAVERARGEASGSAQAALAQVDDAVLLANAEGRIEYANPAATALFGLPLDALYEQPLSAMLSQLGPEAEVLREQVLRARSEEPVPARELAFRLVSGARLLELHAAYAPVDRDDPGAGHVLVLRVAREQTLPSVLGRDVLTGLLNRGGLLAQLGRTLREECTAERRHTLCYIDVDGFEQVNREIGLRGADEALRLIAQELREHARHGDVVARLGGDDFVLLLRDCSLDDASTVTEALLHGIHELQHAGVATTVRASAGLVALRADQEPRQLLKAARQACMQAKEDGGNRIALAEETAPTEEFHIDTALAQARLFQQPLVPLDGPIGGHAEILLRFEGEDAQLHEPGEFLARAERGELMASVDRWVIRKVFAHCRRLHESGAEGSFSINLSRTSLADPGLLEFIREQRDEFELNPTAISFEIDESAALADLSRTRAVIDALHESGFSVTLDDCGSGGYALSYLRDLPVDYLKIGGALVRRLIDDPVDNVTFDAINRIGHLTGKRTVGKWVENDATVKRLKALQVDYAQGFGLAEPMPLGSPS